MMNSSLTLNQLQLDISDVLDIPTTSFNLSIIGRLSTEMLLVEVVLASPELAQLLTQAAESGGLGSGVELGPTPAPGPNSGPSAAVIGGAAAAGGGLGSGVELGPTPAPGPNSGPSAAVIGGAAAAGAVGLVLIIFAVKKVAFSSASRVAKDDYVPMNADVATQLLV
ncbi:transmembrane protein, putative [Bodo saltans]|uniref:Transmembrane protein, putative n=1 Tax=Bodo saltans TaxID=75058 RepID=A0A0S4JS50_BODSA|nr:transmembrane protein, putative [Bodo saltans]|eukprot:CUG93055.1 transmembrane protein, putative [Bodo saltans]